MRKNCRNKHGEISLSEIAIILIGDSTMEHQFQSLCSLFQGNISDIEIPFITSHFHCLNMSLFNTKLEYIKYGKVNEYWNFTLNTISTSILKERIKLLQPGDFSFYEFRCSLEFLGD